MIRAYNDDDAHTTVTGKTINLEPASVLGSDGLISGRFPGFETRTQQIEMAQAVQRAFADKCHLVVEAGTGVGKSFAYLIPAIEKACRTGGKILISTYTINLQEQLINKDIPFLADVLEQPFNAVLAKGRGNYLCKRRLEFAMRRQKGLFDTFYSALSNINNWAEQSSDGSLSDMKAIPKAEVWDAVKSEHGNCKGRKCPYYGRCFYWRARRALETADIVVANHALLFSDLVLKAAGASVLPDYDTVVIDEAHNIEHVAEDHFGIDISNHTVEYLLRGLYNPRTHRGLLTFLKAEKIIDLTADIFERSRDFFKSVRSWYHEHQEENEGRCYKNFVEDTLSGHLIILRKELTVLVRQVGNEDEKFELMRYIDKCNALISELKLFLEQDREDYVYWIETNDKRTKTTRLKSAPVNVGQDIDATLFSKYDIVVMASATLSTGQTNTKEGFDFFAGRIGLKTFKALKLGSPFDYQKQVTIYIEKHLPAPTEKTFLEKAEMSLKAYIEKTQGRAFVLFTSYQMLNALAGRLDPWLVENDMILLKQGSNVDRSRLLKDFKTAEKAVLFGTDSFWQGVDVPGEALSNVIIVRLPFAVPNHPLLAGKLEQIRLQGGNPFFDYQLPQAIIKFKQGFGRLIRNKTDTGIVVILDSRIVNKPYGEKFLYAIPKCTVNVIDSIKGKIK